MLQSLRPAEGNIPGIWSQSSISDQPEGNTNELYLLILAWLNLDISIAKELLKTMFLLQSNSGALPMTFSPARVHSSLEAPIPLLSKIAEKIYKKDADSEFISSIIQPLRRHLQWLLTHFDPKHRGLHCWQNSGEAVVKDHFQTDLATADLSALLISEIESLNTLQKAIPTDSRQEEWFSKEKDALKLNLETQFWNENSGAFNHALLRGKVVEINDFSSFIPLIWRQIPTNSKNQVLGKIQESNQLPGGELLFAWKKNPLSENILSPRQQLLVLEILKTAQPSQTLAKEFAQSTLKGFNDWHSHSLENENTFHLSSELALLILNLQATQQSTAQNKFSRAIASFAKKTKSTWFDLITILICLFALFAVHIIYKQLHRPPPLNQLQMQLNVAYAKKNTDQILINGLAIIQHYPTDATHARLLIGNLYLISGEYEKAQKLFSEVRKENPDSPSAMIALGLTHQLMGNFEEANKNYAEFTYLFENIFPAVVKKVSYFQYLNQEHLKTPPNWKEIYGYSMMHEL
jgi:tetratricopeptide (TPR) repeat protein